MAKLLLIGMILMTSTTVDASPFGNPIDNLKKVGGAKLEVLFWDIYESELYSPTGKFLPDQYPLALKIRYLRNIKAQSLVEKTGEEWEKLGYPEEQTQKWLSQIEDLWPDIQKGDELLLLINSQEQSVFYYNDKALGVLSDETFGPGFAAIWLDENCSYPTLRNQLIGKQ